MNCAEVDRYGPAHAAGELQPELAAEVEAHARGCPRCTRVLQRQADAWAALSEWEPPEPSRAAAASLRIEAVKALDGRGERYLLPFPLRSAATILAILAAAVGSWQARGAFEAAKRPPGSTGGPAATVAAAPEHAAPPQLVRIYYVLPQGARMTHTGAYVGPNGERLLLPEVDPETVMPVDYTY